MTAKISPMRDFTLCYLRRAGILPALLACILLLPLLAGGSFASAATQQEGLHKAIQDFEALGRDAKRGMWRDSWEKLEKRFESIEKQGPDYAAEAFFYRARSLEELADRSKNKSDWQNASKLYQNFSFRYKKHPLADNADYNRAMILSGPLGDKNAAVRVLDDLMADYPDGDAFSDAITLRERLAPESPATSSSRAVRASQGSLQTQQASSATQPELERQKQLYAAAASEWRSLLVDKKRGAMRDNWLNLEKSFASALKAAPAGPEAHKAAYQVARCREELALRSGLKADWQEAASLFANMVDSHPQSSLADDSLYSQAEILARRLNDSAGARSALNELLSRYPSGDMAPRARKLLNELPQSSGQAKSAAQSSTAQAAAKPGTKATGRTAASGNIVEQLGLGIKTIMIDAGHGGKDPGAIGNGLRESTVTLDLAKKVGAELKKKGFTVMYTRDNNRFVALEDRTSRANNKKADIFVSIHVNASTNKKLYGLETYYLDVARSDAARVVAARENAVNVGTASDLQFILSDLTRNTKKEESMSLGKQVQSACIKRLGKAGFKVRSNGVRSAPFYVLMGARMPALLIEIGYLSNKADADRIKNPKYIQAIANGISDGIVAYQKELSRLAR